VLADEEKASTEMLLLIPSLLLMLDLDDDRTVAVAATTTKEVRSCRCLRLGLEGVDRCSFVVIFMIDWILEWRSRRRRTWECLREQFVSS